MCLELKHHSRSNNWHNWEALVCDHLNGEGIPLWLLVISINGLQSWNLEWQSSCNSQFPIISNIQCCWWSSTCPLPIIWPQFVTLESTGKILSDPISNQPIHQLGMYILFVDWNNTYFIVCWNRQFHSNFISTREGVVSNTLTPFFFGNMHLTTLCHLCNGIISKMINVDGQLEAWSYDPIT